MIMVDDVIPKDATVAVQRYVEGTYDKFIGNAGWVNEDLPTNVPPAFAHYSYHITDGEMLVCDLQGARNTDAYILSDPAIHHATRGPNYYGITDLGNAGIQEFFRTHKCSRLCESFLKPDLENSGDFSRFFRTVFPPHRNTVYTYELGDKDCHEEIREMTLHLQER